MKMVMMGRKWEINTKADYENALETLDENEFVASMSDDYFRERMEKEEIFRQRAEVRKQAREKGII